MTLTPLAARSHGAINRVARIGDGLVVTGPTEAVMEFLGLSPQHNEHCIAWRWNFYMQDIHKREQAVREEARKIIAAKRAREDEIEQMAAE